LDEAFAPPESSHEPPNALTGVLAAWMVAFTVLGTALGATLQVVALASSAAPVAGASAAGGLLLGGLAYTLDRRRGGPGALRDARGREVRPVALWVWGIPFVVALLALAALGLVGTVHSGSAVFAGGAALAAVGLAVIARPMIASNAATRAMLALDRGDHAAARAGFAELVDAIWVPAGLREQAALHLGLIALREGRLQDAARWYARPRRGKAAAFAQTGLALVEVLLGAHAPAQAALRRAGSGGHGALVQGEADAVRLLLVLRTEGAEAARELGDRLLDDGAGVLFRAVLAVARARCGDPAGAAQLRDEGLAQAIRDTHLEGVVTELGEALRGPPSK
jgi:hypothetical protein